MILIYVVCHTFQVDVKRTVPKKGAGSTTKWGPRTKKIFLGGLPTSVNEGTNLLLMSMN